MKREGWSKRDRSISKKRERKRKRGEGRKIE